MKQLIKITLMTLLLSGCAGNGQLKQEFERQSARTDYLEQQLVLLQTHWQDSLLLMQTQLDSLDLTVQSLRLKLDRQRWSFSSYNLPESMVFFGRRVEFDTPAKRKRLDRELMLFLGSPTRLYVYFLNSQVYFPIIEELLFCDSMPSDMKYAALVESALSPTAKSHAGASGFWQFMPATARWYDILQTDLVDLTRNLELSTDRAGDYFRNSARKFSDDWLLMLAAYNMGDSALVTRINQQGQSDFFNLWLPKETEEYVLRIMAIKLIFENPADFGIDLQSGPAWEPLEKDTVSVVIKQGLSVLSAAKWCGTTYRAIKLLNPEVLKDRWGPGKFLISLPPGKRDDFLTGWAAASQSSPRKKK